MRSCHKCKGRGHIYTPERTVCPVCLNEGGGRVPDHLRWLFMNQNADVEKMDPQFRERYLYYKRAYEEHKARQGK